MFKIRFNKKIAFSDNSHLRFSVVRKVFYTFLYHKKGVVLFIVLGMLLIVTSLATVILSFILSHSRLTYHQTSRIQAYYAAMAGINYGLEQLRTGTWVPGTIPVGCSGLPTSYTCAMPFVSDDFKPASIKSVSITITAGSGCSAPAGGVCVSATANYTYTTP